MATEDKTRPRRKEASDDAPRPGRVSGQPSADSAPADDDGADALVVRGAAEARATDATLARTAEVVAGAESAEDAAEEGAAPAQLGVDRYVMAGFFTAGIVGAYVLGKLIHGVWAWAANKDLVSQKIPVLAGVADDDKSTIAIVIGALVALVVVLRVSKKPDIREWAEDVADEMTKVKWPTRKDVTNSTFVVLAASAVATTYLFLLDRLWAFFTNLVYATGS